MMVSLDGVPMGLIACLALAAGDWRAEVEELERSGELDRAIVLVEGHLRTEPGDAEAWRWLARTFERLVDQEGRSTLMFSDAAAAWERVALLQPDDVEATMAAVRDRVRAGEFAAAEELALRALDEPAELQAEMAALYLRAHAGAIAAEQPGDRAAFARGVLDVRSTAARVQAMTEGATEVQLAEADWLVSIHLGDLALGRLRAGLAGAPSSIGLHRALVDLHVRFGIEERLPGIYDQLVARHPGDGVVRWYAGYVARLVGDLAARERRDADAAAAYARAVTTMREAEALEPAFAESALWVEMQARTGAAWSALDADDVERAEEQWLALLEEWPEFVDHSDGLGRSPAQGLGRLGGRYHVRNELLAAQRVSRELAEVSQEAWPWQNVAYLLRENASDTERSGDPGAFDMARSTFVESWKTYQRAAELAPHEPRIINDTALIQVYHLQDDLETAEALLHRAIQVGEARLEELGPEAEETERFPLAQAVGDAYQNLGFLHYRLRGEPLKAREYFAKSVATDSGARRGVQASIRAIDAGDPGGRQPFEREPPQPSEPELPEGADPPPPAPEPQPETGADLPTVWEDEPAPRSASDELVNVRWERSIELALEDGQEEGRRVLVYHRVGGGVGPNVEFVQRYLHSDAFERATQGAITVLADGLRHTFADRGRDGRLVMCPRAGGVTCAEHMASVEEFERLWHARGPQGPPSSGRVGLYANGLFEVTGDGLARVGRSRDTFERLGGGRGSEGEPAATTPIEPAPVAQDVAALARSRRLADRRELERRIFDPTSRDERARAVAAVAGHPGTDNDALLAAIASQHVDAELARAALAAWRAELGSEVPLRALQTSPAGATAAAAAGALARVGDDSARRALVARWLMAGDQVPSAADVERLATAELAAIAVEIGSGR
ncbi:MAG: hypothetical protein O7B99_10500 [Planctomycetota bacterium]|nr:hypothetical protein [Planctomycetota bacterium]